MNNARSSIHRAVNALLPGGWIITDPSKAPDYPELNQTLKFLVGNVRRSGATMTSTQNLAFTSWACRQIATRGVDGDFVEVGTWRGGHGIIAHHTFESCQSKRHIVLADTFDGMLGESDLDRNLRTGLTAAEWMDDFNRGKKWNPTNQMQVARNLRETGVPDDRFTLLGGDIRKMKIEQFPSKIAILRVDVDWYQPTRSCLELLAPLVSPGGIIIVDDYGSWAGAKQAVDEYLEGSAKISGMFPIDASARFWMVS